MKASDEADIPAYAELLWRGDEETRPGPKRSLDVHALARAGIRRADAAGLDAVSMRTVSADIGVSSMALYRYVRSKQELLLMMVDEAIGPPPRGDSQPRKWRDGLAAWARAARDRLRAHPWVLDVPVAEPPILPYQTQWTEWGLDALAATPLTEPQKLSALLLVNVYVRGQTQLALGFEQGAAAGAKTGASAEAGLRWGRRLLALTDPARYPRVTAAMKANPAAGYQTDFGTDEFSFGLNTVLDGIQALIAR
jgi:AcrR family transcriptional regulator